MKNIIFDLDGTLLNSKAGIIKSLDIMTDECNLPAIKDYNQFIGPPIESGIRQNFTLDDDAAALAAAAFRRAYVEKYLFDAELYDGVLDMLAELKKSLYQIGIATNKRESYALKIIERFGLNSYAAHSVGSIAGVRATKEAVIRTCVAQMDIRFNDTLYVGDTVHDKAGADKAGVKFLAVTWGFGYSPEDTGINHPLELTKYLEVRHHD